MIPMVKKFPLSRARGRKPQKVPDLSDNFNHPYKQAALQTFYGSWGGFFTRFSFSSAVNFPDGFQCHRSRRFFADKKTKPQPYG